MLHRGGGGRGETRHGWSHGAACKVGIHRLGGRQSGAGGASIRFGHSRELGVEAAPDGWARHAAAGWPRTHSTLPQHRTHRATPPCARVTQGSQESRFRQNGSCAHGGGEGRTRSLLQPAVNSADSETVRPSQGLPKQRSCCKVTPPPLRHLCRPHHPPMFVIAGSARSQGWLPEAAKCVVPARAISCFWQAFWS